MNVVEINKYRPALYKRSRFLREDWTSASQIGGTWEGRTLRAGDYLAVEDAYVAAAMTFHADAGSPALRVHGLEYWRDLDLPGLPLPARPAPHDGDIVSPTEVGDLLRRCLREQAWFELAAAPTFLIHPGYDLRLIVATEHPTEAAVAAVLRTGLFIYRGDPGLSTLESWASSAPAVGG